MFELSFEKLLVLVLVALFVLGPERLPAAASWLGRAIRQVKGYAAGADERLRRELGPELAELREPLAQIRQPLAELRTLRDPRTAALRYLLDDDRAPAPAAAGGVETGAPARRPLLHPGERPPIDADAT